MTLLLPRPYSVLPMLCRAGRIAAAAALVAIGACGGGAAKPAGQPTPAQSRPVPPIRQLSTAPLAGQQVVVLPITLLVPTDSMALQPPFNDHTRSLQWADFLIGATLIARGP